MIVSALLCHDCHDRYESGNPSEGSDGLFFPDTKWNGGWVECPRCRSTRVSLSLKPDPVGDDAEKD